MAISSDYRIHRSNLLSEMGANHSRDVVPNPSGISSGVAGQAQGDQYAVPDMTWILDSAPYRSERIRLSGPSKTSRREVSGAFHQSPHGSTVRRLKSCLHSCLGDVSRSA